MDRIDCPICTKQFRGDSGYEWHRRNAHPDLGTHADAELGTPHPTAVPPDSLSNDIELMSVVISSIEDALADLKQSALRRDQSATAEAQRVDAQERALAQVRGGLAAAESTIAALVTLVLEVVTEKGMPKPRNKMMNLIQPLEAEERARQTLRDYVLARQRATPGATSSFSQVGGGFRSGHPFR